MYGFYFILLQGKIYTSESFFIKFDRVVYFLLAVEVCHLFHCVNVRNDMQLCYLSNRCLFIDKRQVCLIKHLTLIIETCLFYFFLKIVDIFVINQLCTYRAPLWVICCPALGADTQSGAIGDISVFPPF